ncbi:iron ABC transporter permease, partial [Mesorhizobium sp. M1143]
ALFEAIMPFRVFRVSTNLLAILVVLAPVTLIIYQSFLSGPFFQKTAHLSLKAYSFILADADFWLALTTSLKLAVGMTLIAVPVGILLAFIIVRTDVPGKRWLEPIILIPVFMSAVVLAFGYVMTLGPVGFVSLAVKSVIGYVPWNVYSVTSIAIIAGLTHVPHVYLY